MKYAALAVLLLAAVSVNAQDVVVPLVGKPQPGETIDAKGNCSAHRRSFTNPFASNICLADWEDFYAKQKQSGAWDRPFYKDAGFWSGTLVQGTAIAADAYTTSWGLNHGSVETNLFLGSHPSDQKIAIFKGSQFALCTALYAISTNAQRRTPDRGWRMVARLALPVGIGLINGLSASHNTRVK